MTDEQKRIIESTIENMKPGQDISLMVFMKLFKGSVRAHDVFLEAQRVLHQRARFYNFIKKSPLEESTVHYIDIGG